MPTTPPAISVRQATPADIEIVAAVLAEAARSLDARGMHMWRDSELQTDALVASVTDSLFWIAEVDGHPAGVVKFQLSDPKFWPDVPEGESAFIHRLAVRRMYAGGMVSSALMAWALDRARTLGRPYLRLDCEASRQRLRATYERFGFTHHSDRQAGPYFVSRYELRMDPFVPEPNHTPVS